MPEKLAKTLSYIGFTMIVFMLIISLSLSEASEPWKQYDFGGATVRIGMRNIGCTPFAPRGELSWDDPSGRLLGHVETIEERFNCTLQVVPEHGRGFVYGTGAIDTFMSGILAGDVGADIVGLFGTETVPLLASEGVVMPLDDVLDADYYEYYAPDPRVGNVFLGETYRIGGGTHNQANMMIFNKNMFEREGLPDPYELWEAGEWTWDVFREIGEKVTRDTTGDGEINQRAFGSRGHNAWGQYLGMTVSNDAVIAKDKEGRLEFTYHEPPAIEALEFLQDLWEEGLFVDNAEGRFDNDDLAMKFTWHGHLRSVDPNIEYGIITFPKGPQKDEYVAWPGGAHGYGFPVTTGHADLRALVELTHAVYMGGFIDNPHDPAFGMDPYAEVDPKEQWLEDMTTHWVYDQESVEMLRFGRDNQQATDYSRLLNAKTGLWGIVESIVRDGEPVAPTMFEYQPVAQAFLDDLVD